MISKVSLLFKVLIPKNLKLSGTIRQQNNLHSTKGSIILQARLLWLQLTKHCPTLTAPFFTGKTMMIKYYMWPATNLNTLALIRPFWILAPLKSSLQCGYLVLYSFTASMPSISLPSFHPLTYLQEHCYMENLAKMKQCFLALEKYSILQQLNYW